MKNLVKVFVILMVGALFVMPAGNLKTVQAQDNAYIHPEKKNEDLEAAINDLSEKKQREEEYRKAIRALNSMEAKDTATRANPETMLADKKYTLGIDDVVEIKVRGQEDFTGTFVIGPDGMIQYTYVGDVQAAGTTKYELKKVLEEKLTKYIKIPDVSVAILGYRSKSFYILGDVRGPGKYVMRGDSIKLRDALVTAGLPNRTAALKRAVVITPDLDSPKVRKINLKELLYKGILKDDVELKNGDLVVVPSSVISNINFQLEQFLGPIYKAAYLADFAGVEVDNN